MTVGWYEHLKQTRIYAAFLKHRAWAAEKTLTVPLLGCFSLGSLVIVWVFLPLMLITLLSLPVLPILGETTWLTSLACCIALYFVAFGPIVGLVLSESLPWYFAIFWAFFGNTKLAENNMRSAKADLTQWKENHA